MEDIEGWGWVKLSATDAIMLAEVVMAVTESQSQELMSRLRESLVQAILGDVELTSLNRKPRDFCAQLISEPPPMMQTRGA